MKTNQQHVVNVAETNTPILHVETRTKNFVLLQTDHETRDHAQGGRQVIGFGMNFSSRKKLSAKLDEKKIKSEKKHRP